MKDFTALIRQAEQDTDYWIESAKLDFIIELNRLLQTKKINHADLAKLINCTPAYISKVMGGNTNFTIETMVRLVRAVGGELSISIEPKETRQENYRLRKYSESFVVNKSTAQEGRYTYQGGAAFSANDGEKNDLELIAA